MTVTKTPSGRFRASVKFGRRVVASKNFDLKRDADAWHMPKSAPLPSVIS